MIIDLLTRLPFVLKKTLPVVLLLGSLSLALAPKASAQMTLTFTETDGSTTLSYSGSWEIWTLAANPSVGSAYAQIFAGAIYSRPAGTDSYSSAVAYAGDGSWSPTATTVGGVLTSGSDSFSFSTGGINAPFGYSAGDPISGSVLFSGSSLSDLGLSGSSGAINMTGGVTAISWSASVSAVPEPSTYAAIFGVIALGGAACRRRRVVAVQASADDS